MAIFGHYLTPAGLQHIRSYKYTSGEYTFCDNLLNKWWNFVVELLPMWVAPNLLTLLGFIASWVAFVTVMYTSPSSSEPSPPWACLIVSLSVFLYQTLDAIDGKQARRTHSSSPLGTLFDHGCDIMTASVLGFATAALCRTGTGVLGFLVVVISSHMVQFMFMWWEYHFHVFFSNPGYGTGVTEAQLGVILFGVISAVFGTNFWLKDVLVFLPKELRASFVGVTGVSTLAVNELTSLFIILNNVGATLYMFTSGLNRLPPHKRIKATTQILSFVGFICLEWCFYHSALIRLRCDPCLCYLIITSAYSIVAVRILLSSTSLRIYHTFQWPAFPFCFVSFLLFFSTILSSSISKWMDFNVNYLLWGLLTWQVLYLGDLLITAINDISNNLGITCFSISPPPQKHHQKQSVERKSSGTGKKRQ